MRIFMDCERHVQKYFAVETTAVVVTAAEVESRNRAIEVHKRYDPIYIDARDRMPALGGNADGGEALGVDGGERRARLQRAPDAVNVARDARREQRLVGLGGHCVLLLVSECTITTAQSCARAEPEDKS